MGKTTALHEWPVIADTPARPGWCWCTAWANTLVATARCAEQLNTWGFAVRGYDHSTATADPPGRAGGLSSDTRLLDDLADMIGCTPRPPAARPAAGAAGPQHGRPGGGAAGVAEPVPVDALVLSSPALDAGLGRCKKLLVSTLPSIAPNLRVGNGLNANYPLTTRVVADYQSDRAATDRISARLAASLPPQTPPRRPAAHPGQYAHLADVGGADRLVTHADQPDLCAGTAHA